MTSGKKIKQKHIVDSNFSSIKFNKKSLVYTIYVRKITNKSFIYRKCLRKSPLSFSVNQEVIMINLKCYPV